jgi:hypothetical protein
MVNTDFFQDQDHTDDIDEAPYRTFGLGLRARGDSRVSIRREHR